jgi:hypothetical protein
VIGAELKRAYFDVTNSGASNARSRAIEAKLIFITFFRDLPAVAMSHQIWSLCATAVTPRITLNSQPD